MSLPNNTLHQGDCLDIMKSLDNQSVDMILCDLPYGSSKCKWDIIIPFEPLWEEYKRITKSNGAIVLTATQPFASLLICSNLEAFKYDWVWHKTTSTGHLNSKIMPMRSHEAVLVFGYSKIKYNPQKTYGHIRKVSLARHKRNSIQTEIYGTHGLSSYDSTERFPRSVLTFKTDKQKQHLHPTQKPVSLFEYLIRTYTDEGDLVLDNCAGSGTTGIACINTKRQYILIEKELKYCEIIATRIKEIIEEKSQ